MFITDVWTQIQKKLLKKGVQEVSILVQIIFSKWSLFSQVCSTMHT